MDFCKLMHQQKFIKNSRCRYFSLLVFFCFVFSCTTETRKPEKDKTNNTLPVADLITVPEFNADSAYKFIAEQVALGPRVPNTEPHKKCAEYIQKKLKACNMAVDVQEAEVTAYNEKKLNIKNITGKYLPDNPNRIMLYAHWDTRPYADRDVNDRTKPIDGANDGASGVAVLIELARTINTSGEKPKVGIDFVFFDAEDYGQPSETMMQQQGNTWCLGSQYWAQNLPENYIKPRYGILLDMVGAENAVFPMEGMSLRYAPETVRKVWSAANKLGYSKYFSSLETPFGAVIDDHKYINEIAKIPSIDIIDFHPYKLSFGEYHHTHKDNISIISKNTLKAVGQTIAFVIYHEK
jgi:glutaminyl-peptide cyclotransferase